MLVPGRENVYWGSSLSTSLGGFKLASHTFRETVSPAPPPSLSLTFRGGLQSVSSLALSLAQSLLDWFGNTRKKYINSVVLSACI